MDTEARPKVFTLLSIGGGGGGLEGGLATMSRYDQY